MLVKRAANKFRTKLELPTCSFYDELPTAPVKYWSGGKSAFNVEYGKLMM